jgi:uncharacterized membrane protein YfcA
VSNPRPPIIVAIAMAMAIMVTVFITDRLGWQDANTWTYVLTGLAAFAGGYLGAWMRQRT